MCTTASAVPSLCLLNSIHNLCEWIHRAVGAPIASCLLWGHPTEWRSQESLWGTREEENPGCSVENHCTQQVSI
ncbi:unnamed protein product, partial [Staurois parvus]